tara:strand:- start:1019 stop:1360 length:342 start_codon:yes stop_codon:yes gene_type:complete
MNRTHVYKLLTSTDWAKAQTTGITATALDESDGYVHLSASDSVADTSRLHYAGQKDVQLLEFTATDLSPLRWEPSRGGTLFPHLYGPLEVSRATRKWTLPQDSNGVPMLPEDL